jgi:hypothetical protein
MAQDREAAPEKIADTARGLRRLVPPPIPYDPPAHLQGTTEQRLHLWPCFPQVVDVMERTKNAREPKGEQKGLRHSAPILT